MPGFSESQMPINFDPVPAEKQGTPESPEERSRIFKAYAAIKRIYPHGNIDEFELRSSEKMGQNWQMIFRRPADIDMHKEEVFLQITLNSENEVIDIHHIYPSRSSVKKVSKKKRKGI